MRREPASPSAFTHSLPTNHRYTFDGVVAPDLPLQGNPEGLLLTGMYR